MNEPLPEQFSEIVRVLAEGDRTQASPLYCCQQIAAFKWRCGKCGRGVLLQDDANCRMCNAHIVWHKAVNAKRYHEACQHFWHMEAMERFGA